MLRAVAAHAGQPPAPHDVWSAWNADPLITAGLILAAWVYLRGRRVPAGRADRRRAVLFAGGLAAVAVAILSPLDAVSAALASAHMVQHMLLVLVAAPLLALSAPSSLLLRGTPLRLRRALLLAPRRLGLRGRAAAFLRQPVTVALLHVGALWAWHAAALYDAALSHPPLHALEHATFLVTGVLFWHVVVGARGGARTSQGLGVMLVFGMSLQGVLLSLLLTFAGAPWYDQYASTTAAWNLDPLADQQLAGVIMWIPGGFVYLATALILLVSWIRTTDGSPEATEGPVAEEDGAMVWPDSTTDAQVTAPVRE